MAIKGCDSNFEVKKIILKVVQYVLGQHLKTIITIKQKWIDSFYLGVWAKIDLQSLRIQPLRILKSKTVHPIMYELLDK